MGRHSGRAGRKAPGGMPVQAGLPRHLRSVRYHGRSASIASTLPWLIALNLVLGYLLTVKRSYRRAEGLSPDEINIRQLLFG